MHVLNNPFFTLAIFLCIVAEYLFSRRFKRDNYDRREALSSLAIIIIDRVFFFFPNLGGSSGTQWIWNHRLVDLSFHRNWVVTLIAVEFAYYWTHRYNHNVSLGWASHSIHHSPTRYNLTMGYRLGLTRLFSLSYLVFFPLIPLGFHPDDIALCVGIMFVYQFFIHTEFIPKLGFLDRIFNTPSNHRVHHAADPNFYGKNLGGFTVIFDRFFGTYAPEPEGKLQYGMPEVMDRKNFGYEILNYWATIGRALRKVKNPWQAVQTIFGSPDRLARESTEGWGRVKSPVERRTSPVASTSYSQ